MSDITNELVARSEEIEEGGMQGFTVQGRPIAIYRVDGQLYATDNICTHGHALMTDGYLEDRVIECPLHGGRFDIATGEGLGAPITCALACHKVEESDGQIRITLNGDDA
ncbi:non-heme iron oxygenase ferredoxin subunit [Paraburkholderia sprentiae WSM5005]|uniref:Non-heme iron oxygenase ferredoxin subunit n=1 Tax=Paraburkholderia sprentiae WSM5005 TaxID=754502 RepID=A0A1I9YEN7_9BURK|nr:non-heme iron oxygenase ferredoxin subunit [Paraburkholderia sprentiae]APA84770.1 non-heme iron oxygenase ferredoxin subunit [Paraburkholderia sprentiae WSM5005]